MVTLMCALALVLPAAATADSVAPDGAAVTGSPGLLDGLAEIPTDDVPAEIAGKVGPGGKVYVAPPHFGIDYHACVEEFGSCEAVAVVTASEEYLIDVHGNRIDIEDAWRLDALGLAPGINAGIVGSSTAYRWQFNDTIDYAGVIGTNVVYIGRVRTTQKITLEGRWSTWKQSSDAWDGPSIKATNHWNCVDDNGHAPNSSCSGGWQADPDNIYRYGTFWSQDQRNHSQVETYWYDFRTSWKATGWSGWTFGLGNQTSHKFDCPSGGGDCEF